MDIERLVLKHYNDLSNEFVMNMSEELYSLTKAYRTFSNREQFLRLIKDTYVRQDFLSGSLQYKINYWA